jgi:hypothetical protein
LALEREAHGRMDARSRARLLALAFAAASSAGCALRPSPLSATLGITPAAPAQPLAAKSLLYVSDWSTNAVYVYDYETRDQIGKLGGFKQPSGECVDRKGDIWITNFQKSEALKYAHGGSSAIERLQTEGFPIGCAVSTTGDLAIVNFYTARGAGNLEVWENGGGKPTTYKPSAFYYLWPPAYDDKGDLFLEGLVKDGTRYGVTELAHDGKALRAITLKGAAIHYGGAAEWDGTHVAFTDQSSAGGDTTVIYRVAIKGTMGTVVGRTHLSDNCHGNATDVVQPFIVQPKGVVVGGNLSCKNRVDYWAYPSGGAAQESLHDGPAEPFGAAVSP